jgi:hypothetical protein
VGDLDMAEVQKFAAELGDAGPKTRRRVAGSLTRHTNAVHRTAIASAHQDRGWLKAEGIRKDTQTMSRRVFSPPDRTRRDGKPRNVGMHEEFGTARRPPAHPFLLPALGAQARPFISDVERIQLQTLDGR